MNKHIVEETKNTGVKMSKGMEDQKQGEKNE